jgi:starch synthase
VIATSVGGIPEVVMHGVTGDLVPLSPKPEDFEFDFAETINLLYADDQRRARYGKAGRERVQREFGWDQIAEQTRDLYRALVE